MFYFDILRHYLQILNKCENRLIHKVMAKMSELRGVVTMVCA
jgi:hypothetical protein